MAALVLEKANTFASLKNKLIINKTFQLISMAVTANVLLIDSFRNLKPDQDPSLDELLCIP